MLEFSFRRNTSHGQSPIAAFGWWLHCPARRAAARSPVPARWENRAGSARRRRVRGFAGERDWAHLLDHLRRIPGNRKERRMRQHRELSQLWALAKSAVPLRPETKARSGSSSERCERIERCGAGNGRSAASAAWRLTKNFVRELFDEFDIGEAAGQSRIKTTYIHDIFQCRHRPARRGRHQSKLPASNRERSSKTQWLCG